MQPAGRRTRQTWRANVEADNDLADVQNVLAGDLSGFDAIVRRWQGPLINLAWRFVRDRGRAEEMAQEVFLKAFMQLRQFRGDSAFSTWLFAVALNVYRSALRRRSVPSVSLDGIAEVASYLPPQLTLEDTERDALVRRAVTALPPRYRDALTVFYFNEMNLAETARILMVPEGTAKARLHRGRALLRLKLSRLLAAAPAPTEVPA
jgi:RNA polymerase sigma-70 factor (ECF subfamily)